MKQGMRAQFGIVVSTLCVAASVVQGATLTLTTSDAQGKSSFDTWNVSGGGAEAPTNINDYVVSGGKYIRIQWNRTFGGNTLAFGEIGSADGGLVIQRGDSNVGHSIGFGNNGAILNRGFFTMWAANRTPTLINEGPLTVMAPESNPFRIALGEASNTNNSMTISATIKGAAGTALLLCSGSLPKVDSFTLSGEMSEFKGRLIVAGGREQASRNYYPVSAVLAAKTLGGTLVVQPDASVRAQWSTTTFTTAGLELQEGSILIARCTNAGDACGRIVVTESLSVEPGVVVKLSSEPYWTSTNGFDEVVLTLPQEKGTIPLDRFKLELSEEKVPLELATNLVDGVWQLVVHKDPHDLLSVNDVATTSPTPAVNSCLTNATSWYRGEVPHAGMQYMANIGSGGLPAYPIVCTPYSATDPYVFAGDALVLGPGSRLFIFTSDTTFRLLALSSNITVPLSLTGVPGTLRGTVRLRASSDRYPQVFQAYFYGVNIVEADMNGPGTLFVTGRQGSGKPFGDIEFTALNTNFTGRIKVFANVTHKPNGPEANAHERVFLTDARNLGGPLAEFKADALELADYSELVPRNDVDLNVVNRGITITSNGCFTVQGNVTLTVSNDITYNGTLRKTGAGLLMLNSAARVADGAPAALAVDGGLVGVGVTNALSGVAVTFADGARLLVDPAAEGDVATFGAVDLSASPFGGSLPVAFKLSGFAEGESYSCRDLAVCTVANQDAADALVVSAERIQGYRVAFSPRVNDGGTVTILARIVEDGLTVIFR